MPDNSLAIQVSASSGSPRTLAPLPACVTAAPSSAGYQLVNWYGLFAPAGTPPEVVAKLNIEVTKILRTPEFSAKMRALGGEANPMTPVQFGEFVRSESATFKRVIEQAKVVLTD